MIYLDVKFAGLDFKNPISVAAHGPSIPRRDLFSDKNFFKHYFEKLWRKYYEMEVGSITTGTIFFDEMPDARGSIRFCLISAKGFAEFEGFVTAATMPDCIWPRTPGLIAVEKARKEFPEMRIIASIMGMGTDPESWGKLALEAQQAGAEAIELNLGSVMMMESATEALRGIMEKRRIPSGAIIGLVPEVVAELVKGLKKLVNVPIIVKITPELGFYGLLGALPLYKEAGVDGLTCDHTIMSIAPPNIYEGGKTTHPYLTKTSWWSSGGPWNRMVSYRDIALVGRYSPDMDVAACGGLVLPEHVIEVMMFGAKLVQLSSGIHINGVSFPGKVVNFLKKYMQEQGYSSVKEFIGLGQKFIAEMGEVQAAYRSQVGRLIAHVDYEKCKGPNDCKICLDNFCLATYEEEDKIKVDPMWCCGCNLCVIRCPSRARSLGWVKE